MIDKFTTVIKELDLQNEEKEKLAKELVVVNKEINKLEELLQNNLKEISDYKYAMDESCIIAITDQKGIIKQVNKNFCLISKYSEKELIGQDHRIINSGYHPKELIRDLWTTIANGNIWKGELKNKAKDGTFYWMDTTIVPFLNNIGKPYQYLAIRVDITARKETEEYLRQRTGQLETANKELESFNYISSHDLQEPLRKIQIFVNRIMVQESKNLSDKGKEYFLCIEDAANHMQTLIEDLLSYSRTTTSERKFETVDLNAIIEEVKKDYKETIEEKKATIEVTETCNVRIIPFQFHQLLHNLIGNALKFSKPDIPPHIIIKSRAIKYSEVNTNKPLPEKDYCHITISDNGIGFEPKYKDLIFEMFQRLHDKKIIRGTGIGLTIVKKIVDNHNGIITATGTLNKGATFDIYIPST